MANIYWCAGDLRSAAGGTRVGPESSAAVGQTPAVSFHPPVSSTCDQVIFLFPPTVVGVIILWQSIWLFEKMDIWPAGNNQLIFLYSLKLLLQARGISCCTKYFVCCMT